MFKKIINLDNHSENKINCDFVTSQHYIFSTYILSFLEKENKMNINVFEIGGGFGNMRRICSSIIDINSWTIFDIDSTLYFNKEFYKLYPYNYELTENEVFNNKGFYNINTNFRDNYIGNFNEKIDVVIATHSLSELDMNEFYWYYNNIIKKCNIFLYCTQTISNGHNPVSGEISNLKINMIKQIMKVYLEIPGPGEERGCKLFIFKK